MSSLETISKKLTNQLVSKEIELQSTTSSKKNVAIVSIYKLRGFCIKRKNLKE